MLLLKITNKTRFLQNSIKFSHLNYLFQKIKILEFIKKKAFLHCLHYLIVLNLFKSRNLTSQIHYSFFNVLSYFLNHQKPINYIINVNLSLTNTLINVSDVKGNSKTFYSAGMLHLKSKQKTKQPIAIITIFRAILKQSKFLKEKSVALHYKNLLPIHESFITKRLKQQIFIKTIKSYNYRPHNGCRLRKKKRTKIRTKKF